MTKDTPLFRNLFFTDALQTLLVEAGMIDWNRVRELQDEVGDDSFDEVFELFVSEVSHHLEACPTDRAEWLHALKGCALNLGFSVFVNFCASGESDPGSVTNRAVRDLFHASLEAFLAERSAQL